MKQQCLTFKQFCLLNLFIFSSFQWANAIARRPSSVCLSVRPFVCKLLGKQLLLPQTWLDCHQTSTRWSPDGPASRVCSRSRSKVTWYRHFFAYTKITSPTTNMTGSRPNLHTMVSTWTCTQGVLKVKVKVKGHVIRALLWCQEMFAIQYGLTFCLYMRSLYETPLYSPSSISIRLSGS